MLSVAGRGAHPPTDTRACRRTHPPHADIHPPPPQYLAEENEDEDPEVRVVAAQDTPAATALRDALLRKGGREVRRGARARPWGGGGRRGWGGCCACELGC